MPRKLTQAEFLAKAIAVHGVGRYDYSQAVYASNAKKVNIICLVHGAFEQTPNNHISQQQGCPKCADIKKSQVLRGTAEAFVTAAQAKHGIGRYDYSQVVYTLSSKKVKIICTNHGAFLQAPAHHIHANGCPRCGKVSAANIGRDTVTHFIQKARAVHGNKYDYSHVVYNGSSVKVKIGCPAHGAFEQRPSMHVFGSACPTCAQEKQLETSAVQWCDRVKGKLCALYFIRLFDSAESFYKVGVTSSTVRERYRPSRLHGYQYEVLAQYTSTNAAAVYSWEQSILETFAHLCYRPKKRFGGETECFSSADEILSVFPR